MGLLALNFQIVQSKEQYYDSDLTAQLINMVSLPYLKRHTNLKQITHWVNNERIELALNQFSLHE